MSETITLETKTINESFSLCVEEGIQSSAIVDGKQYILPTQLTEWAKYALQCWINPQYVLTTTTATTKSYSGSYLEPPSTVTVTVTSPSKALKPSIKIVHDETMIKQIFIVSKAN